MFLNQVRVCSSRHSLSSADGTSVYALPIMLWADKLVVAPFRKRMLRAACAEVAISNSGPRDLMFVPEGVDVQDFWREVLIPPLLQLQKGTIIHISGPTHGRGVTIDGTKFKGGLFLAIGDHVEFVDLIGYKGSRPTHGMKLILTDALCNILARHNLVHRLDLDRLCVEPSFADHVRHFPHHSHLLTHQVPTRDPKVTYDALRFVHLQMKELARGGASPASQASINRTLDAIGMTTRAVSTYLCDFSDLF